MSEISSSTRQGRKPRFFYGYIILVAGFFILVIINGALYSFGVFLKPLSADFGWTRAETSGAYSMFMFLCGFLYTVAGRLTDRLGPRLVLTIGGVFAGLGYLLMSQVNAIWQLYLFFGAIVAIGHSGGLVTLTSTVARWFVRRRGLMTGIVVSGIGIGTIVMPPAATQLISNYGLRTSYIIIGSIALALVISAAQFLRRDPGKMGQLPDGDSEIKTKESASGTRGFHLQEAIHTRQFWMLCVLSLFHGIGQQAIIVHIAPHATDLGISAVSAASILSIIGGLSIAGRIGLGSAGDRMGSRLALSIAFILLTVALFFVLATTELWMFYLFAVVFGIGYGGVMSLLSPMVADLFGLRAHGSILGMVSFSMMIGCSIGSVMAGRIFDVTGNYQLGFLLSAVLSAIALALTLLLRVTRRNSLLENVQHGK